MKRLLDRLMARQNRLMQSLVEAERPAKSAPPPSPVASRAQIEAEEVALSEALLALETGDLVAARSILAPHVEAAVQVRTLTTLSRICSAEGNFEEALSLLKRAEVLAPGDRKVWRLLADLLGVHKRATDEVHYRRKLAFVDPEPPAQAHLDLVRAIWRASPKGVRPAINEVRLAVRKLAACADATPELTARMAEAVYGFTALAAEARALYLTARPRAEGELDTTARWLRLYDWCTESGAPLTRLTDEGIPAFRPMIAELQDVSVFPQFQWVPVLGHGQGILSGFAMQRIKLRSEEPLTPLLMNNAKQAELRFAADLPVIDTPALLIGGVGQYYHNTVDFLGSLAIAERAGVGLALPLVVNDDLAPFQLDMLSLLGYGSDRLIRVRADRPVTFRRLTVPSRLVKGGRWVDPMLPRWYRERLLPKSPMPALASRRLYVSRREAGLQRLENEAALEAFLSGRGYEVVVPERLSVLELVNLFAQASHIVSPTGAGLTNMLFAAPGAAVVALYNRHLVEGGGDIYFDALAAACGHRFLAVQCAPARVSTGQRVIDADLIVDLDAVAAALEAI